ncbi:MAG: sigma-70 family RNA polymerase sigma factor [Lachnospiraceae bacterium]|nr:sigma-70 family RNA polymerase sigma factor [Lachnospiraceae bacterium]
MSDKVIGYEDLYKQYAQKVYNYLYSKIQNPEDAQDLQSTVFVKAFEKFDSYDPSKASPSTWIYTITNNTLIDYYRTRHVHEELDDNSSFLYEDSDFNNILNQETLSELALALNELSERERELIILRYYHNLTLKEIAEKMNFSYGTAKLTHNSALMNLKRLLSVTDIF